MTQNVSVAPSLACLACGTAMPRDRLVSLELDVVQRELQHALDLLDKLKPMLITASYYLDQHVHLLQGDPSLGAEDAAPRAARQAQARQLSGELMDAYCRNIELLALARR